MMFMYLAIACAISTANIISAYYDPLNNISLVRRVDRPSGGEWRGTDYFYEDAVYLFSGQPAGGMGEGAAGSSYSDCSDAINRCEYIGFSLLIPRNWTSNMRAMSLGGAEYKFTCLKWYKNKCDKLSVKFVESSGRVGGYTIKRGVGVVNITLIEDGRVYNFRQWHGAPFLNGITW